MATEKKDQTDLVADNAALTTKLNEITALRDAADLRVTALTGENTTLKADKANLETKLTAVNADLAKVTGERDSANAEVTKLTGEKTTLEKAVASKVVALGITNEGATADKKEQPKAKTMDEKLLEAKGVKSYEELVAKREAAAGK